jgi:hypothetical protein
MSRAEIIENGGSVPTSLDPEKLPARVTDGQIGDQISHEMLRELAPNGEEEYILDKINNMTEEEAVAIIQESRESAGRCGICV